MRLYRNLRDVLKDQDVDQNTLGAELGMCATALSNRMCGRTEWELGECYQVLNFLGLPHADLPYYFPPGGKWTGETRPTHLDIPEEERAAIAAAVVPLMRHFGAEPGRRRK